MVPGTWWAFFNTFGGNELPRRVRPIKLSWNTVGQLQMEGQMEDLEPEAEAATCNMDQVVEGSVLQESRLESKAVWGGGSQGRILNEGLN